MAGNGESLFDAWFLDNGIEEFKEIFVQEGFKDLETVSEITSKEELEAMGISLLGNKLKLMAKIRALKRRRPAADPNIKQWLTCFILFYLRCLRRLIAGARFTENKFSFLFFLFIALPWAPTVSTLSSQPGNSKEGYSKYLYQDPKHERTNFFNEILPQMYKHAQPHLLGTFSKYLYKEREERYQTKKLLEGVHHDLSVIFSEANKASCFTFLSENLTTLRHNDIDIVNRGLNKMEEIQSKLEKKEAELKSNIDTLFNSTDKLHPRATEQYDYSKATLEEVGQLLQDVNAKCEKLSTVKKRQNQVFQGIPKKNPKSRKVKENRRKAERRKEKRLLNSVKELKSKIIKLDSQGKADECVTKEMLQLGELEKLRRDRHKAALTNLLHTENWHMDARKCIEVKLTE
ncbi:uncharacterized protein LOC144663248 [Oculina patagonica]